MKPIAAQRQSMMIIHAAIGGVDSYGFLEWQKM